MALSDPLGSSALDVLKRNSEDFDKVISGDKTVVTRTGKNLVPVGVAVQNVQNAESQALIDIQADVDAVDAARLTGVSSINTDVSAVNSARITAVSDITDDAAAASSAITADVNAVDTDRINASNTIDGYVAQVESDKNTAINTEIPSIESLVEVRADTAIKTNIPLIEDKVQGRADTAGTQITSIVESAQDSAENKLDNIGFTYKDPQTFNTGATMGSNADALIWATANGGNGEYYRWTGRLPKTVPAGSTPDTTGGVGEGAWRATGFNAVLQNLASSDADKGAILVKRATVNAPTVAAAKAVPAPIGAIIETEGYNSLGDGGGNDYIAVAGGTGTDDGGSFIDMDNGLQLKALFKYGAKPEQYGLYPGDTTSVTPPSRIADSRVFIDNLRQFNFHTPGATTDTHTFLLDDSKFRIAEASRSLDRPIGGLKKILFIGDSLTEYNSTDGSYTSTVAKLLSSRSGGIKEVGYLAAEQDIFSAKQQALGFNVSQSGFDYLYNGSFPYASDERRFSPDGKGASATGATGTAFYKWNCSNSDLIRYTKYRLYYLQQPGGGTFDLQNRGGTVHPINTDGALSIQVAEHPFVDAGSTLNRDMHVINATGDVTIYGVELIDETAEDGFSYDVFARQGGALNELMQLDSTGLDAVVSSRNPDVAVINIGTNDSSQGRTPAQFEADLTSYIARLTTAAPGVSIVIVTPNNMQTTNFTGSQLPAYEDKRREFCRTNDYMYIDLPSEVGNFNYFAKLGWMRDGTHPNIKGQEVIGLSVSEKLIQNSRPEFINPPDSDPLIDTTEVAYGNVDTSTGATVVTAAVGCTVTYVSVGVIDVAFDEPLADSDFSVNITPVGNNRTIYSQNYSVGGVRLGLVNFSMAATEGIFRFSITGRRVPRF